MTNKRNQIEKITNLLANRPFNFYNKKIINKAAVKLDLIVNLALQSIPNLKVSPYTSQIGAYETQIEFIQPYELNIIVNTKENMLSNEKKENELENNFKERLNKPFIMHYGKIFSGVRITDYSRDENTHVAHITIPRTYLS